MTQSEIIVSELCNKTFLSFWSFPNPIVKKGKEHCDILVVCEPDIIIFSVKEIKVKKSGNPETDENRWIKKAVDASVKQIYGAERLIRLDHEIYQNDNSTKIILPKGDIRKIYRIAVALGRGDKFPLPYGDFGKGFVHVFDERSVQIILNELDTISDFKDFLDAEEEFIKRGIKQITFSGEDQLALYLQNGYTFPEKVDLIYVMDDLWTGYIKSDEYLEEKKQNEISYLWDGIIETLYNDFRSASLIQNRTREQVELTVRQMNKENRFARRQLSHAFSDLIGKDDGKKTPIARAIKPITKGSPAYVFLSRPFDQREDRIKELELRCFVAHSMYKDTDIVIGLATEKYKRDAGFSIDICYQYLPNWTDELDAQALKIKEELGYVKEVKQIILKPN